MARAVVVGSGPNGLAAAIVMAQAGHDVAVHEAAEQIGGGTRSHLNRHGLLEDHCSAFHPMGRLSPFLRRLPLDQHGLHWARAPIDLAHPLDDGRAGLIAAGDWNLTRTSLGADAVKWERQFAPLAARLPALVDDVLAPALHWPRHPYGLLTFLPRAALSAQLAAQSLGDDVASALFMGCSAHAFGRLDRPLSASIGYLLAGAAHAVGWPVAVGGSQSITAALASYLHSLGGTIHTHSRITSLEQLRPYDLVFLDTSVKAALALTEPDLPFRVRQGLRLYRYGPAAFKVDFTLNARVPWMNPSCANAATLHLGGSAEEIALAERRTGAGEVPRRPFMLVGQQFVADPGRTREGLVPLWTYAHVPHGYAGPSERMVDAVMAQIERFAPGFSGVIDDFTVTTPADFERGNANYIGGDIGSGANFARQLVFRPRPGLHPYRLTRDVYLCSSATPPGGGVHGMCGAHAARAALRDLG